MYASIVTLLVFDYEWLFHNVIFNLKQCASFYCWLFSSLSGRCCRVLQVDEHYWQNKDLTEFHNGASIFNENVFIWLRKVPSEELLQLLGFINNSRNKEDKLTCINCFQNYLFSTRKIFGAQGTLISDSFVSILFPVLTHDIIDKGAEVLTKVCESERDSQMDLAKVVPGLTSLEMLVPPVQSATVNVVQVSGNNAVINPQAPVSVSPGQNNLHTPVSIVSSGIDIGESNSSSHGITDLRNSRPMVHQNIVSVSEQVTESEVETDESHPVQEGTQVSPHIQKVGQPYKSKEPNESEQDEKSTVYRLIMKEGSEIDQYFSNEQSLEVMTAAESNNAVSYSQDLIKMLKKKKERDNNKINENAIASLPKFQQAFGRQLYQSMEGGRSVQESGDSGGGSQFGRTISDRAGEPVVAVKEDNTLSKAVQTVLKEAVSTKVQNQQQHAGSQQITKETPDIGSQSQGVIFTCKVPISLSNSTLLQGKPVAILKGSDLIVHSQKVTEGYEGKKDSVIRSNMSALLAAALQSSPMKTTTATGMKKQDKCEIIRETINKVHLTPTQVQKPKRSTPLPTAGTKLTRPEGVQTRAASPSSLVTIPLPARTVVLTSNTAIMNQPRTIPPTSVNKIDRTDQANVCSSTLEQLREFESVLEHVTNTSQMKERCVNNKPTQQSGTVTQEVITVQSQSQQTQVTHHSGIIQSLSQQQSSASTPPSPKGSTPNHSSTDFTTPVEITERVVTLISKSGSTTVQAVQTTGNISKLSGTPVVVVQSCNNRSSSPSSIPSASHKLKISKPKVKANTLSKTTPISTPSSTTLKPDHNGFQESGFKILRAEEGLHLGGQMKVSTLTKPQQKPQEDEQTTQRIYAILDKYAEQLRNSPELKNKPAPRRRSNPPTNPAQSSKRKKGGKKSSGCCSVDASPGGGCCEDVRTLGSEDSSTEPPATPATTRHTDDISLPGHLQPEDVSSETCESSTDSKEVTTQTMQQPSPSTVQQTMRQINQHNQPIEKQQTVTGRTLLVQDGLPTGSVLNVEHATKVLAGKQLVVGTPTTVPLTLSLPAAANLKQVIFPVPADGRPFVVAKVPKMYRVHQVTVPGNSPLIAASTGGAVLLRQMCLNKTTVKQVKVPVQVSSIAAGTSGVVLPGGSGSFTLDGDSLVLDNNTILLNTSQGTSGTAVSTSGATVSLLQRTISTPSSASCVNRTTSSSTMTSHSDQIFTQDQALQTQTVTNHEIKYVNRSGEIIDERGLQKPWMHILKEIKVSDEHSLERKEDVVTSEKGCNTKSSVGKCMVESVIKVKPSSLTIEKNETSWPTLTHTPNQTVLSVRSAAIGRRILNTNPTAASLAQDTWRKSRDLRLQKSLSEECEDLGVDKPSTSDLFPEAELLLDTDPLSRDSLHEMYSSSSRDSSPTPRYQWKKRGLTSRLLGKRQESDSSCPSTPVNGDQADESETGSECDWWPESGENGRTHNSGVQRGAITAVSSINQIARKRKIGLYATDSDDTDLDDSSSEKGGALLKSAFPPLKRECHYVNGSPIRNVSDLSRINNDQQLHPDNVDHHIAQQPGHGIISHIGHIALSSSTSTVSPKSSDIELRLNKVTPNASTNVSTISMRLQHVNKKR